MEGKGALRKAGELGDDLTAKGFEVLGPAELHPWAGIPRFQLLIKGEKEVVNRLRQAFPSLPRGVKIDPDPLWLA